MAVTAAAMIVRRRATISRCNNQSAEGTNATGGTTQETCTAECKRKGWRRLNKRKTEVHEHCEVYGELGAI